MKHEIEIPDLPEGWEAVAYRRPKKNVDHVLIRGRCQIAGYCEENCYHLIVRKKKTRRIVLEESDIDNYDIVYRQNGGTTTYWKIVEDTNARNN